MLNDNSPQNIRFKDLTKREKIGLIISSIYVIVMIVALCFFADKYPDRKDRLPIVLIFLVPFFIFLIVDFFIIFFLPDKEALAANIYRQYNFLFDLGYEAHPARKNKKFIKVYFTNADLIDFCFIVEPKLKMSIHYVYFFYKDKYLFLYNVYDYFMKMSGKQSGQEENETPKYPEEIIQSLLELLQSDRKHFFFYMDSLASKTE